MNDDKVKWLKGIANKTIRICFLGTSIELVPQILNWLALDNIF